MTEPNFQHDLSACRDGELTADATRFLLRRLDRDAALAATWSRYELIGAGLRRERGRLASADFTSRVMAAVDATPASMQPPLASRNQGPRRWLQWSVGGAIAASVAVIALVTGQPDGSPSGTPQVAQLQASPSAVGSAPAAATPLAAAVQQAPAQVPAWLSGYSASRLSQRASATLGGLPSEHMPADLRYRSQNRYPMISTGDGSYLILLDPAANSVRSRAQ